MCRKCTGLLIAILLLPSILWADAGVSGSAAVNLCESNSYTVDLQNTFGAPAGALVVNASLGGLTGFSYLPGTTAITINGVTSITTADPQINGGLLTWDLDALAGGGTILESGDTLTVDFQLQTACNAVSGTLGAVIDYQIGGAGTSESANMEIQVNPGVATITRTPAVVPAALGDNVTWTISVENTGSGAIENLVVTDLLGDGLTYVSSSPAGSVSGRTVTWDAGNFPALAHMDPGDIVTLDITATVTGTVDLVAAADVRWGCDTGTVCYDSAVAGDTARASVALAVQTPFLDFTPPDIGFTYGAAQETVAFTILNDGDGTAHDIFLSVDVGPLTVSDISAGAAWDPAQKRFALTDALAAGGSYALSFTLNRADWCTGDFPAGDLDWEPLYADDAGNPYRGPVMLSQIDTPIGQPGVTLAVTGAPSVVVIGGSAGYTVTSSGSGITGPVTVTDQVPAGFTVTDTGGGVWSPGGDGTGGQIVWVYDPAASLTAAVTLQAPPAGESAAHCNTTATGTVTAAAPDAAGCTVSETDTWNGRITCGELATSNKTATPDRGDRGTVIAYTNTYTFGGATGALLSDLVFTEAADQGQAYEAGTLAVTFDGGDITGSVAVTDNTAAGGGLILDFSGCGNDSLDGKALSIAYSLRLTANAGSPCTATAFWDGSVLDTDPGGGTIDGQIHNTVAVTVTPPQMTVDIAGLGGTIDKGETRTVTLTVTQTSDVDPRDVKLVLSGLNYQVVNPAATICSGVAPVSCTPAVVGDDTVWTFMDAFAGMGQSTAIQIELMKRCGDDPDLTATAHYDGLIDDDDSIDERCGASQTVAPLLRAGEIHLETAPDTIVATTDTIQYTTYVVNTGSGTASNVWVDNVLGSGLIYEHGVNPVVVDDMTDVTINDSLDHNGFALNGASVEISEMAPGERREITWIARAIDCNNLTADVSAAWGCLGTDCQAPASDSLAVELPDPVVGLTVAATPSGGVDFCAHPQVTTTIENFGTTTVYNNQVTVTLPHGLACVSGSTRWRVNGGGWNGPNAAYDPNSTTSPLVWTSTEIPGLATLTPDDTLEIEHDLAADCPFTGGDITAAMQFESPCADVYTTPESVFPADFNAPEITVAVNRADEPIGCNDTMQWTLTVRNDGGYALPVIWVEATMDAAFTYASSVGDPPYTSDNGTSVGQVTTWELRHVNPGDTVTLTLNATSDAAPCSSDLDLTVAAWPGCGLVDGSSATKPGVDAPDDSLCLSAVAFVDTRTETREPELDITLSADTTLGSCNDSGTITMVVENSGPLDAFTLDAAFSLPAGITYVAGTAEAGLGTDEASARAAIGAIGDPAISGSQLIFYDFVDKGSNVSNVLQAAGGNDTLVLEFEVGSSAYTTADIGYDVRYYGCCDDNQYSETGTFTLDVSSPALTLTQSLDTRTPGCGGNATLTITAENTGTATAQVVRAESTLGSWIDYAGTFTEDAPGTVTPALVAGNPQVVGWEFTNLAPGATRTFTFDVGLNPDTLPNQNDCDAALRQNRVRAVWGCGTVGDASDDDPNTTGYDATAALWAEAAPARLLMPDLVVTGITPTVSATEDGILSGTLSATVENRGDAATDAGFTVTLDDGMGWTGSGRQPESLAPGAPATVAVVTAAWAPACGTYTFTAAVDTDGEVCECDEGGNTFQVADVALSASDLTVTDIDISGLDYNGDPVSGSVTVTIENTGSDITGAFVVALSEATGALVFEDQTVTGLGAGQTVALTFAAGGTALSGSATLTATVDADDTVAECDGTNNTLARSITLLEVTNTNDSGAGSLRDAVAAAGDHDTIRLGDLTGTIVLTSGAIDMARSITLLGAEGGGLSISGSGANGIFTIQNGAAVHMRDLWLRDGYTAGDGGGVRNAGDLTLRRVTISGCAADGNGGGLFSPGDLDMANCTLSGNSADTGGGLYIAAGASARVSHCTVAGNSAATGGGIGNAGTLDLEFSIIADSVGGDVVNAGTIGIDVYNLAADASLPLAIAEDPQLGGLEDNGGAAPTHAIPQTSPAFDAIAAADCTDAADQRKVRRPQGDGCDIGAFELAYCAMDSDGDGVLNCDEDCPDDPGKIVPGACGCGVPDTDRDGDGTADCMDRCPHDPHKTVPGVCGCGTSDRDTDGDGTADCMDNCPDDPGKTEPGTCGCGTPDTDRDGDGVLDCNDGCPDDSGKTGPGACGCGIPDTDTDGDGTPDCDDNCPDDPGKTEPGICGCGTPDTDSDGDGVFDCIDRFPDDATEWSDTDGDGTGDNADPDADGNGLPDDQEPGDDVSLDIVPDTGDGWRETLYYLYIAAADGTPVLAALQLYGDGTALAYFGHTPSASLTDAHTCPGDLVMGVFTIRLQTAGVGAATFVRLYFSPSLLEAATVYYKYDSEAGWQDYTGYIQVGDDLGCLTVELVDGGYGDGDGIANGVIVCPIGALVVPGGNGDADDGANDGDDDGNSDDDTGNEGFDTGASSGGGGGCFIGSVLR